MALTGTVAVATTTVPNPLRNERRLISDWDDSLWGRSLMLCVIGHADKRGRGKGGLDRCTFAETSFKDVIFAVVNPLQGERWLTHDRLAGYANCVRLERGTRGVPQ